MKVKIKCSVRTWSRNIRCTISRLDFWITPLTLFCRPSMPITFLHVLSFCFSEKRQTNCVGEYAFNLSSLLTNLTLSSFCLILHCHSFKSRFKFFTFILSHASLRIILSNEGDAVSIDRYDHRNFKLTVNRSKYLVERKA